MKWKKLLNLLNMNEKRFCLSLILLLSCLVGFTQVPEPTIQSMRGFGGSGTDRFFPYYTTCTNGDLILNFYTNSYSGEGDIDLLCSDSFIRNVFVKIDRNGQDILWSKCFDNTGDSIAFKYYPNATGAIIVGEFIASSGWGLFIQQRDSSGAILWQHNYSKGQNVILRDVLATKDGGFVFLSESSYTDTNVLTHYGSWTNADLWVLKVDSLGNKAWSRVIGGTDEDDGGMLATAPNGGVYVLGVTSSVDHECTGNHGLADVLLVRLDSLGNIIWHHDFGGTGYDGASYGISCVADGNGGVLTAVVAGSKDGDISDRSFSDWNFWVMDVDSSGTKRWDKSYGGGGYEEPFCICKASDGTIWIGGTSSRAGGMVNNYYGSSRPSTDGWVVHADSVGNLLGAKVLGSSGSDKIWLVAPLAEKNVLVAGYYDHNDGTFTSLSDYDGTTNLDGFISKFFPWTTNTENVKHEESKVYPNPIENGYLKIESPIDLNAKIFGFDGLLLGEYSIQAGQKNTLDLAQYPQGIYMLVLISANGAECKQIQII